jgi:hypothetical protein
LDKESGRNLVPLDGPPINMTALHDTIPCTKK